MKKYDNHVKYPRKLKKALQALLITWNGKVILNARYRYRNYPRTKWVVRAEWELKRLWRESILKDKIIEELESELRSLRSKGL